MLFSVTYQSSPRYPFFDYFGARFSVYFIQTLIIQLNCRHRIKGIEEISHGKFKKIVGIASGSTKADSIVAAIKGGYINALVTDEQTAYCILKK